MRKKTEKKARSLKRVTYTGIFVCVFILQIFMSAMGLRLYINSNARSYKYYLNNLTSFALSLMDMDYVEEVFEKTKSIYNAMPEEIKADPFTEEFKAYFWPLLDERYYANRHILSECREHTNVSNIYMGFYDEENKRLVLVLDGDTKEYFYIPGQYIADEGSNLESLEEIQKIMSSDKKLSLAISSIFGVAATDYVELRDKGGNPIGIIGIDTYATDFASEVVLFIFIMAIH